MTQTEIDAEARAIWAAMTPDERYGVKFGLYPADKMPADADRGRRVAIALIKLDRENTSADARG